MLNRYIESEDYEKGAVIRDIIKENKDIDKIEESEESENTGEI